jgi:hypothetical protein
MHTSRDQYMWSRRGTLKLSDSQFQSRRLSRKGGDFDVWRLGGDLPAGHPCVTKPYRFRVAIMSIVIRTPSRPEPAIIAFDAAGGRSGL